MVLVPALKRSGGKMRIPKNKRLTGTIGFSVMGYVNQDIEILVPGLTVGDISKGLEAGHYATTLHGGFPKVLRVDTGQIVALVTNTDNECEYTDFRDNT